MGNYGKPTFEMGHPKSWKILEILETSNFLAVCWIFFFYFERLFGFLDVKSSKITILVNISS